MEISFGVFSVGGSYITVRGCAPFDEQTFNPGMQRQMVGTYWKGFNVFSMCDYDICNSGHRFITNVPFVAFLAIMVSKMW
jgi:hypothetical protein